MKTRIKAFRLGPSLPRTAPEAHKCSQDVKGKPAPITVCRLGEILHLGIIAIENTSSIWDLFYTKCTIASFISSEESVTKSRSCLRQQAGQETNLPILRPWG